MAERVHESGNVLSLLSPRRCYSLAPRVHHRVCTLYELPTVFSCHIWCMVILCHPFLHSRCSPTRIFIVLIYGLARSSCSLRRSHTRDTIFPEFGHTGSSSHKMRDTFSWRRGGERLLYRNFMNTQGLSYIVRRCWYSRWNPYRRTSRWDGIIYE